MTIADKDQIERIRTYYKEDGLALIGLNDSMGASVLPWQTSLLKFLKKALEDDTFNPIIIDGFSLLFNKTEHLEYFIQNNLSSKQIALANYFGAIASFEKIGTDIHLGPLSKLFSLPVRLCKGNFMHTSTPNVKIADTLKEAPHVVAIIGTGSNDEMRYVGNNPVKVQSDYKHRARKPDYDYTLERSLDPNTLPMILDRVKRNIEYVLNVKAHGTGDIRLCVLSQFIPSGLQKESMIAFQKLILEFNELLKEICKEYKADYIDQMKSSSLYKTGRYNFHLPKEGLQMATSHIIDCIYKGTLYGNQTPTITENLFISNEGPNGVKNNILKNYEEAIGAYNSMTPTNEKEAYEKNRFKQISDEHIRERMVMEKVLQYTRTHK